jgi:superfamily II DNA helicase RecQ
MYGSARDALWLNAASKEDSGNHCEYGHKLIQSYSTDHSDADKNNVCASFAMNICRIRYATEACGMGMNVPDVVHYKSFSSGCLKFGSSLTDIWSW